jgi:hypothetical protein
MVSKLFLWVGVNRACLSLIHGGKASSVSMFDEVNISQC